MNQLRLAANNWFYSHVNYSVTKIAAGVTIIRVEFYSHVNYSVTKIHMVNWKRGN